MKKNLMPILGLALAAALLFGVWHLTKSETKGGEKYLCVEVLHGGSAFVYEFTTDAEFLAEALVEEGIVEDDQGPYGLYILTVDGVTANEGNQEWWCITKGGESLTTGASDTPIADGDHYELTLTVGYDF